MLICTVLKDSNVRMNKYSVHLINHEHESVGLEAVQPQRAKPGSGINDLSGSVGVASLKTKE